MASLQVRIIESLIKDLESIKDLSDNKAQRKEYSLILKRIESAKKLFLDDKDLTAKLLEIEIETQSCKA